jgi:hypothetical protein
MDMNHERLYTLRFADLNGDIDTIGPFNKFTKSSVHTFLKYHLKIHDLEWQMSTMIEGEELTDCQHQIEKLQNKIQQYIGVESYHQLVLRQFFLMNHHRHHHRLQ